MREWLKNIFGLNTGENKAQTYVFASAYVAILLSAGFGSLSHSAPPQPITSLGDAPRLKAKVVDSSIYTSINQVWWMDDHRLIMNGGYPADERDPAKRDWGILIWDTRDNSVKAYQSNKQYMGRGGWVLYCFNPKTQQMSYLRREMLRSPPYEQWRAFVRRGEIGKEKEEIAIRSTSDVPELNKEIPFPKRHIFSCLPKPATYDTYELVKGRETIDLFEEHGYIDIGPRHAIPIEARKAPHLYYRHGAKEPIVLKGRMVRPAQTRLITEPWAGGYYYFANLYQGGVGEIVHFNPDTADITQYQLPEVFLREQTSRPISAVYPHKACSFGSTYTKDRKFIVQCSGNKENGFYYWDPRDNRIERLLTGHDTQAKGMISPDGCKFAFVSWKPSMFRDHIKSDVGKTLKIIDVCQGVER